MVFYRKEISDFIRLSETLLSPTSLGDPLTIEERQVIDFYVRALSDIARLTDTPRPKAIDRWCLSVPKKIIEGV